MRLTINQQQAGLWSGQLSRLAAGRSWKRIFACFVLIAALASAARSGEQDLQGRPKGIKMPDNQPDVLPDVNQQMLMHEQQVRKTNFETINFQRRKIIVDESTLLLKLATDLKTEVDKTNKDELSLTVIRKADVIEKLAHDMKEKMKLTVGAN